MTFPVATLRGEWRVLRTGPGEVNLSDSRGSGVRGPFGGSVGVGRTRRDDRATGKTYDVRSPPTTTKEYENTGGIGPESSFVTVVDYRQVTLFQKSEMDDCRPL